MATIQYDKALELIEALVKEKGSQVEAAKSLDISPTYLGDIRSRKRLISDAVAQKLGYKRVTVFVKDDNKKELV